MTDPALALAAYVQQQCGAVDVEVHAVAVDDAAVHGAERVRWAGDPCRPWPVLRLEVLRDGAVAARYTVRPSVTVWVEGWVAAAPAAPGEAVAGARGRFALGRGVALRVQDEGPWRAAAAIEAGQPLTRDVVEPLPDATRGAEVQLVVQKGGITLTADGRLLQDGTVGEPVRVRNDATQTAQVGVLVAPRTVELR